jgi:hypothetical protein
MAEVLAVVIMDGMATASDRGAASLSMGPEDPRHGEDAGPLRVLEPVAIAADVHGRRVVEEAVDDRGTLMVAEFVKRVDGVGYRDASTPCSRTSTPGALVSSSRRSSGAAISSGAPIPLTEEPGSCVLPFEADNSSADPCERSKQLKPRGGHALSPAASVTSERLSRPH